MKNLIIPFSFLLLVVCLSGCKQASKDAFADNQEVEEQNQSVIIDTTVVAKSQLVLNQIEGTWYYKSKPFNGYSLKFYNNGVLQEKLGFLNGKRQGIAKRWSELGVLRVQCYYNQNNLVGIYKSFWENGELSEESTYENGVKQGVEKQWYDNGQLSKLRHLVDGNEVGMQQAWLKNGTLYVNYEAKNGRVFGLLRSNLCYQLENEKVIKD
ncbi:toxin-antitoxin system YwqK family antitoxin [Mariniflexile gromovii]|uniref:MORN repeat protein n=1 Tax=Mariniflexile gromovii TaxID=362523 RepID=A0ABS4BRW3_9FLAO|nr:hypothetical protein [Mariniflexile gromovii]MBP0903319.1 hypothetical protein [Mariniflexile gromovii]